MTETITVELEVEDDTIVKTLLQAVKHKRPEIKGFTVKGRVNK